MVLEFLLQSPPLTPHTPYSTIPLTPFMCHVHMLLRLPGMFCFSPDNSSFGSQLRLHVFLGSRVPWDQVGCCFHVSTLCAFPV